MKIKHLDLFSGIGGFALAADWVWGKEKVEHIFCEIEEFPQKVLMKHWPGATLHDDITKLDGTKIADVSLLTGGFPCQPYSVAGKQRGAEDDRALWPEMLRVISETKPRWIIGENVGGFVSMGLDDCLSDLAGEGYDCQPMVIPACAVNALHRRDRVWIVANSISNGEGECGKRGEVRDELRECKEKEQGRDNIEPWPISHREDVADTKSKQRTSGDNGKEQGEACEQEQSELGGSGRWRVRRSNWATEPAVGRVVDGVPTGLDRLKGLGNAIVPQVAAVIMQAIKDIEDEN